MKSPNGSESVHSPGPWAQLVAIRKCPCTDGRARTVRITGQPNSAFSCPASVVVKGKRVTGYVTTAPTYQDGVLEGSIFYRNAFGKNAALLPESFADGMLATFKRD